MGIVLWSERFCLLIIRFVYEAFEVLNAIFQAFVYATIFTAIYITIYTLLETFFNILLAVELLMYSKKYFLIQQNKTCLQIHNDR